MHILFTIFSTGVAMLALQEKFHQACDAGDSDEVRNILIDLKDNDYMMRKVLLHRNENGQSCLHLVCTNPQLTIKKVNQVIDVIFECVECQELLYELVCMKNGVDKTILHLVCENEKNVMILHNLLTLLQQMALGRNNWTELALLTDSDNNTALHLACEQHSSKAFGYIFRLVKDDDTLIKKILTVRNKRRLTPLHVAAYDDNLDIIKMILDHVRDEVLLEEMLMNTDEHGDTVLHVLAYEQEHAQVIDHILKHIKGNDALIKKLLPAKNEKGMTLLHVAAYYAGNLDVTKVILDHVRDEVLLEEMLMITDEHGDTVLHVLACKQEHAQVIDHILKHIQRNDALITKLLPVKNKEGMTVLHVAAYYAGNLDVTKMILDHVRDDVLLEEMLMNTDENGDTVLHVLGDVHGQSHDQVIAYVEHILEHIKGKVELLKKVMKVLNNDGMTILHLACDNAKPDITKVILDHVTDYSLKEEMLTQTCNNTSIMHNICKNDNVSMLKVILDHVRDDVLLKEILMNTDKHGCTVFHLACLHGCNQVLEHMFKQIKGKYTWIEYLLTFENNSGETLIHMSLFSDNPDITKLILGHVGDVLLEKTLMNMDQNDDTVLHRLTYMGHDQAIDHILRHIKGKVDWFDKVKKFKNDDGMTVFHLACDNTKPDMTKVILDHVTDDTLKKEMLKQTCNNTSILHTICKNDNASMLKVILDHAGDDSLLKDMLKATDVLGYTAVHLACMLGQNRGIRCLEVLLLKIRHSDIVDSVMLEKDGQGRTLLHIACQEGFSDIIDILFKYIHGYKMKDCILALDNSQKTPFHLACAHGHHSVVEALIRILKHEFMVQIICNASKNIKSPLSEAVENGHHKTVNVIVSMAVKIKCLRGLLLECKYSNDQTLLHLACNYKYKQMRCLEIVLNAVHAYTEDSELFRELFLSPDEDGRTFLCYLSDSSDDMIRLLLKWAIEWDKVHSDTYQRQSICYQLLHQKINSGAIFTAGSRPNSHNKNGITALQCIQQKQDPNLSTKISTLSAIFDNLDSKLKDKPQKPSDFVLFEAKKEDGAVLLRSMCDANCLDLIQHEYTKKYLYACWKEYGLWFFIINMVLYTIMLSMLTTFVVSHRFDVNGTTSNTDLVLTVNGTSNTDLVFTKASWINYVVLVALLIVFSFLTLVYEILQMIAKKSLYFYEFHNYVDLIVCMTSLCLPISSLHIDYNIGHHSIGALVMCLAWVNATWMITRVHVPSRDNNPFGKILKKIILVFNMLFYVMRRGCFVIPVFAMLTLTFALCFHTLFQTQEPFSNFGNSLLRTIGMTIGELDMVSMFFLDSESGSLSFKSIGCILFTIFLYMMTISAMNLLVGMAVGDIKELGDKGEVVAFETLVELILESRRMLSVLKLCYLRLQGASCRR